MTAPESRLAPARRPQPAQDYDEADLARGQAAAVLGALGRMQLRLDVLAREQADAFANLTALVESIDQRLARLEGASAAE